MTVGSPDPDRSESFGEGLLGGLLDRAHELPPHLVGPVLADTVARLGGRDPQILLQDYGQQRLVPLPGEGLAGGEPQVIDGSEAGRCFLTSRPVELVLADGVRVLLPLLDGVTSRAFWPSLWTPSMTTTTACCAGSPG